MLVRCNNHTDGGMRDSGLEILCNATVSVCVVDKMIMCSQMLNDYLILCSPATIPDPVKQPHWRL